MAKIALRADDTIRFLTTSYEIQRKELLAHIDHRRKSTILTIVSTIGFLAWQLINEELSNGLGPTIFTVAPLIVLLGLANNEAINSKIKIHIEYIRSIESEFLAETEIKGFEDFYLSEMPSGLKRLLSSERLWLTVILLFIVGLISVFEYWLMGQNAGG